MKYIDAEKLKAEIRIIQQSLEHRDVHLNQVKKIRTECMIEFCKRIFDVIDSLQQEQPEAMLTDNASFTKELKRYLSDTGNEKKRGGVILPIIKHFYELGLNTRTK